MWSSFVTLPREEYAARTLRPKIHRIWEEYFRPLPDLKAVVGWSGPGHPTGEAIDPDALLEKLGVGGVGEVTGYRGGPVEAARRLKRFVKDRLPQYASERNEPTPYMTSELSAHLHFGQISP